MAGAGGPRTAKAEWPPRSVGSRPRRPGDYGERASSMPTARWPCRRWRRPPGWHSRSRSSWLTATAGASWSLRLLHGGMSRPLVGYLGSRWRARTSLLALCSPGSPGTCLDRCQSRRRHSTRHVASWATTRHTTGTPPWRTGSSNLTTRRRSLPGSLPTSWSRARWRLSAAGAPRLAPRGPEPIQGLMSSLPMRHTGGAPPGMSSRQRGAPTRAAARTRSRVVAVRGAEPATPTGGGTVRSARSPSSTGSEGVSAS